MMQYFSFLLLRYQQRELFALYARRDSFCGASLRFLLRHASHFSKYTNYYKPKGERLFIRGQFFTNLSDAIIRYLKMQRVSQRSKADSLIIESERNLRKAIYFRTLLMELPSRDNQPWEEREVHFRFSPRVWYTRKVARRWREEDAANVSVENVADPHERVRLWRIRWTDPHPGGAGIIEKIVERGCTSTPASYAVQVAIMAAITAPAGAPWGDGTAFTVAAVAVAAVAEVQIISTMASGTAVWSRKPVRSPSGPCLKRCKPLEASPSTGLTGLNHRRHLRFPGGDFPCGESLQDHVEEITVLLIAKIACYLCIVIIPCV